MKYNFLLKKKVCQFLSGIIISVLWTGLVKAEEIYFQPSINIKTEYDDNKRLSTDSRFPGIDLSAYGVIARANAKIGVRSDRYEVAIDNQVSVNRYESEFDLDSDDFRVNLNSSYNLTARSRLGLSANYTRDTTLTSELDGDEDIDDDGNIDIGSGSGLVNNNVTRQKWSVAPNWSYSLSERQRLQASYSHTEVSYEDSSRRSLVDYTIDFATINFRQQWTPLFSNSLNVSAMYYDVPERDQLITEYSVSVGADYQISPTWSTSVQVGSRFTNTEATGLQFNFNTLAFEDVTTSDDVQGMIYSASLNKQFETGDAGVSYSRSTSAQSDGRLQVRDSFSANFNHNFSERLRFSVTGGISESSASGNDDDGNDRTNYRVKPSIRWAFDKHTSLTAGYQYRSQVYDRNDEEAVSNSVFLSFNYQWDKFKTQRW